MEFACMGQDNDFQIYVATKSIVRNMKLNEYSVNVQTKSKKLAAIEGNIEIAQIGNRTYMLLKPLTWIIIGIVVI